MGFVTSYGLVRYSIKLGSRYSVNVPCEIYGCEYLAGLAEHYEMKRRANFTPDFFWSDAAEYVRLPASFRSGNTDLLMPGPRFVQKLNVAKRSYEFSMQNPCKFPKYRSQREMRKFFDHCHRHGWVRGILCESCNAVMGIVDQGRADYMKRYELERGEPYATIPVETYRAYRLNCPDCASESLPAHAP